MTPITTPTVQERYPQLNSDARINLVQWLMNCDLNPRTLRLYTAIALNRTRVPRYFLSMDLWNQLLLLLLLLFAKTEAIKDCCFFGCCFFFFLANVPPFAPPDFLFPLLLILSSFVVLLVRDGWSSSCSSEIEWRDGEERVLIRSSIGHRSQKMPKVPKLSQLSRVRVRNPKKNKS